MKRSLMLAATLLAATQLSACDRLSAAAYAFQSPPPKTPAAPPVDATPLPSHDQPLKPAEAGEVVDRMNGGAIQTAAAVTEVRTLSGDAKLFGMGGGDPAMNGLYVHLAFYTGPMDGWAVFQIGDFLSFKVLGESLGRVDLEVEESVMDDASGQIGSRKRRLIVGWRYGRHGEAPTSVTVTPAQ